jgi:hypothetical protein
MLHHKLGAKKNPPHGPQQRRHNRPRHHRLPRLRRPGRLPLQLIQPGRAPRRPALLTRAADVHALCAAEQYELY